MNYTTHVDIEIEATRYRLADMRREADRVRGLLALLRRQKDDREHGGKAATEGKPNRAAAAIT